MENTEIPWLRQLGKTAQEREVDLAQEMVGQQEAKGSFHKKGAEVSQPVGAEPNPGKALRVTRGRTNSRQEATRGCLREVGSHLWPSESPPRKPATQIKSVG